jgi:hypothetical protein
VEQPATDASAGAVASESRKKLLKTPPRHRRAEVRRGRVFDVMCFVHYESRIGRNHGCVFPVL